MGRYFILHDKIGEYLLLPLKHSRLLWNLAFSKIFLHSCPSLATVYQILIPIVFKSSSTSSILHRPCIFVFVLILRLSSFMGPCMFLTMPFRILKENSFLLRSFSWLLSPHFTTCHIKVLYIFLNLESSYFAFSFHSGSHQLFSHSFVINSCNMSLP